MTRVWAGHSVAGEQDSGYGATGPRRLDREAIRRSLSLLAVLLGLFLIPILGHGCHGADVDLEPSNNPPEARP